MISKKLAIEVLNEMLATGADYAEIFYEESTGNGLTIENGKVSSSSSGITSGAGLRLLKENQSVYGFTSDLTRKGLLALARDLNKSFSDKRILTVEKLDFIKGKNRNPVTKSYQTLSLQEKIDLVREGIDEIESMKDPRIVRYIGNFGHNHRFVAIYNSKGKWFKRDTEFARLVYSVIVADENGMETGFEGPGAQQDISYFKTTLKKTSTIIQERANH